MSIQQELEVVKRGQARLSDPETTQVDANLTLEANQSRMTTQNRSARGREGGHAPALAFFLLPTAPAYSSSLSRKTHAFS